MKRHWQQVYSRKFLATLSLSILSLGFAISPFINKSTEGATEQLRSGGIDASAESGPLNDLSPEVRSRLTIFRRLDENYTRGSAPSAEGVRVLRRLGIKSLVDLRSAYDRTEGVKAESERLGLSYHWLPLSVWYGPSDAEARKFLSLVTDGARGPFFVFCSDGMHRTGEMSAIYRIDRERWSVERALDEMDEVGFKPHYYALRNFVWTYARKFRPESLPEKARRLTPLDEWDRGR